MKPNASVAKAASKKMKRLQSELSDKLESVASLFSAIEQMSLDLQLDAESEYEHRFMALQAMAGKGYRDVYTLVESEYFGRGNAKSEVIHVSQ